MLDLETDRFTIFREKSSQHFATFPDGCAVLFQTCFIVDAKQWFLENGADQWIADSNRELCWRDDRIYMLDLLDRICEGIYFLKKVGLKDAFLVFQSYYDKVIIALKVTTIGLEEVRFRIILRKKVFEIVIKSQLRGQQNA